LKDKRLEKKNAELVKKKLSELLSLYGFIKTKPTFFTRLYEDRIEFIHLHKFSYGPAFRVHTGIRFLKDNQEFVELNGIEASGHKNEYPINYDFSYHKDNDSINRCANQFLLFVENESLPWLENWRKDDDLFNRQDSPFRLSKKGLNSEESETLSKKLLGIKN
jgi:hypothetical protein